MFTIKIDLTRDALKTFSDLGAIAKRECAYRSSLVVCVDSPEVLSDGLEIKVHPSSEYSVIKAPTLEGTELWIVAKMRQSFFEKTVGFETASESLLTFKGESLRGLFAKHPIAEDEKVSIQLDDSVKTGVGTGVESGARSGKTSLPLNQLISILKDSGNLIPMTAQQEAPK